MKTFFEIILKNIFRIPILIGLISYVRFIFCTKIMRQFKTLYPIDNDLINQRKNEEFQSLKKMSSLKGDQITALNTNLNHTINPLKNIYYNISQRYSGQRSSMLISPLKSLDFLDFKKLKILSIGPRTEGEIFNLVGHGFKFKNIKAIDLQSYSKLITLGDMLDIPYEDNTFDIIICGWVISYTNNVQKAFNEMIRVSKNNALICIGISDKESKVTEIPLSSSNEILSYFKNHLKEIYFKYHPQDIKNKTSRQNKSFRSITVVEIQK